MGYKYLQQHRWYILAPDSKLTMVVMMLCENMRHVTTH